MFFNGEIFAAIKFQILFPAKSLPGHWPFGVPTVKQLLFLLHFAGIICSWVHLLSTSHTHPRLLLVSWVLPALWLMAPWSWQKLGLDYPRLCSVILCLGAESGGASQALHILRSTEILKGGLKYTNYSVLYLFWNEWGLSNYLLTGIFFIF